MRRALGATHQSIDIENRAVPPPFDSEPHTTLVTAERSAAKLWLVARLRQRRDDPNSITIVARKISILILERCGAHRPVDGCQFSETQWHRRASCSKGGWHLLPPSRCQRSLGWTAKTGSVAGPSESLMATRTGGFSCGGTPRMIASGTGLKAGGGAKMKET